jgi:hypothetical protein
MVSDRLAIIISRRMDCQRSGHLASMIERPLSVLKGGLMEGKQS